MKTRLIFLAGSLLAFGAGCSHRHHLPTAHAADGATKVIASPGTLTIVQQTKTGARSCTLQLPKSYAHGRGGRHRGGGARMAPPMAHSWQRGDARKRHRRGGGPGMGRKRMMPMPGMMMMGARGRQAQGGKGAMKMDMLLFRLCEARSNGDISPEQYNAALTKLLDKVTRVHTPPKPPGGQGRANGRWFDGRRGQGPWGRGWRPGPKPEPGEVEKPKPPGADPKAKPKP